MGARCEKARRSEIILEEMYLVELCTRTATLCGSYKVSELNHRMEFEVNNTRCPLAVDELGLKRRIH